MRYDRDEFLSSPLGRLAAHNARSARQVWLKLAGQPQSKNSATESSVARDQADINQQMTVFGRKGPFRVPVVLQLDFSACPPNPPDVHTLAKHYLDVLQQPLPRSGVNRPRLLLNDDRQVRLLFCGYDLEAPKNSGVVMRVATLTDFVRDLELYADIKQGNFDGVNGRSVRDWINSAGDQDEERFADAWQEHRRHQELRAERTALFGPDGYSLMEEMHQRDVQELTLGGREPRPDNLAMIYAPHVGRPDASSPLHRFELSNSELISSYLGHPVLSVNLSAPAVRRGESDAFKAQVRLALGELRVQRPWMFPLRTMLGITVLYTAPASGQAIDLDNLARRIVPFVHSELKPPSDPVHLVDLSRVPAESRQFYEARLQRLKRTPKHHVTRYQVLRLPRHSGDPAEGSVKLVLHGGQRYWGPWAAVDDAIGRWAQDVRDE